MSIARWFGPLADGVADRPLVFFEGGSYTYGEVKRQAWRIGSGLQRLGVMGERVVTIVPNDPELLSIQLGTMHAGGLAVPVMSDSKPDEVRHLIDDARPSVVIASTDGWNAVADLVRHRPDHVILTDSPERALAALEEDGEQLGCDPVEVPTTAPMGIMYTSGSTARPKGVVIDGASFIKDAEWQPERFGFEDGETVLGCMPLYHLGGWHQVLGMALGCRGAMMMQRRFSASRFWPEVDATGAVGGLLMPAMVSILLARPEHEGAGEHPLRVLVSHFRQEEFIRRFGVNFVPVWGQTETGGPGTSGKVGVELPASNCAGWPVPETELEIRDPEDGRPLPVGESGEIFVRSPWLLKDYWNAPELTAEVIQDGWLKTGDIGWLDEEGRLYYVGRLKAMIKRAGENISAREVEAVLESHPDVAECAIFGVPDPIRTEEAKAVLTSPPGRSISLDELVEYSRERLAEFKVPRYWEVREEMPHLERSMKIALSQLAAEHEDSPGWDRTVERGTPAP